MGINASESSGTKFEPLPQGVHNAICYAMYDLGTQHTEYKGEAKQTHQVLLMWEVPSERIEIEKDGQKVNMPRVISKKYTLSLGEKANLRRDLQGWRGRAFTAEELANFDITKILGVSCMIQVLHTVAKNGNTYANITSIMPLMKGAPSVINESPLRFYSIPDHGGSIPEGTPKWVAEMIRASIEWESITPASEPVSASTLAESEEVPF